MSDVRETIDAMTHYPVVARPHPMKSEPYLAWFPQGTSLAQIVGVDADPSVMIAIEGEYIPRDMWERIKPKAGQEIQVFRRPGSDTAKKVVGAILMIVIAIFAPYLLSYMYSMWGIWGAVAAVGITLLATMAVMALIPPPEIPKMAADAGESFNRLSAITGTSNQAVPYGTIPMVLGTSRFYPTFAANPYTEILGDQQYLRCLFDLGYGSDMDVSDIRIGETAISSFDDVEYEVSTDPDLFTDDVFEAQYVDDLSDSGDQVTKTTQVGVDEISVDIVFGGGLFGVDSKGKTTQGVTSFTIEYRAVGSGGAWTNVASIPYPQLSLSSAASIASGGVFQVRSSQRKTLRLGFRWTVATGQYDVRITRSGTSFGDDTQDNAKFSGAQWATLRSIKHSNPSSTGTLKLAVRIKATEQLNGVINQLSVVVQQKVPIWNGSTWSAPTATSNPAWVYTWLLRNCPGVALHVDDSRLDMSEILAWANYCTTQQFTCKGVIDRAMAFGDLARLVLATGMASFRMVDGKYSVLWEKSGLTPTQHFSPANTSRFNGQRMFIDMPHALRVKFANPAYNWQEDEIVVVDDEHSYNGFDARGVASALPAATKFETLTLPYVTEPRAAWIMGRFQLAQGIYRSNTYSWETDVEHIRCTRGDLVYSAHDVTDWGAGFGLIKDVTRNGSNQVTVIHTAEPLLPETGETYSIRVRTRTGNSYVSNITGLTVGVEATSFTLATPMASDVDITDVYLLGKTSSAIRQVLITRIEPMNDLRARMSGVEYSAQVASFISSPPSSFTSAITGTLFMEPPPPPNITAVFSDGAGTPNDGGTINPGINLTLNPGPSGYRGDGGAWRNFGRIFLQAQ